MAAGLPLPDFSFFDLLDLDALDDLLVFLEPRDGPPTAGVGRESAGIYPPPPPPPPPLPSCPLPREKLRHPVPSPDCCPIPPVQVST